MPAYQRLAELEEDTAVVEVPLYADKPDANEMLSSLYYRKYLVNGVSGFVPPFTVGLAQNLREPTEVFPSAQTIAMLRSIYPLRYVLVHSGSMAREERPKWEMVRNTPPPSLRYEGTYGASDLYELIATPERGDVILRQFSYDFVRRHPRATVALRSVWNEEDPADKQEGASHEDRISESASESGGIRSWVDVSFNGRPLESLELTGELRELDWLLQTPYRHSAANELVFSHRYELGPVDPEDARYHIGESGPVLGFDLMAMADTLHPGSTSSLMVNGRRTTLKQPGYNLTVLDPRTGEVLRRVNFPTHRDSAASSHLLELIDDLTAGTVVVVSTSGDAFARLSPEGRRALSACGSAVDQSQHPSAAHVMIGYKGAEPGSVPEQVGERVVRVVVGQDPERVTLELVDFSLSAR